MKTSKIVLIITLSMTILGGILFIAVKKNNSIFPEAANNQQQVEEKNHSQLSAFQNSKSLTKRTSIIDSQRDLASRASDRDGSSQEQLIDLLQKESKSKWDFQYSPGSDRILLFRSGNWTGGKSSRLENARLFLGKFSGLFGSDKSDMKLVEEKSTGRLWQLEFQQQLSGARYYNSRIGIFFNEAGEVVYVVNDTSPVLPAADINISSAAAAEMIDQILDGIYKSAGVSNYQKNSTSSSQAEKIVFNAGAQAEWAYRFVLQLQSPLYGDEEIILSAVSGAVLLQRNLAKK
jgi:hypothetical protein